MSVQLTVRTNSGVSIIAVKGRLVLGPAAQAVYTAVMTAYETTPHLLLNLEDLAYIDSAGLGELISAYSTVSSRGGLLKLLRPSERVRNLLRLTKAERLFEIFDDEAAAVASFRAASPAP